MRENRLGRNIVSLYVLQGANYLLPLVTLPYLVRVLGPEKYGLIAFTMAFIGYFTVFVDYGFNLSATREIARQRDNPAKVAEIFSVVMSIKIVFMLAGFVLMSAIAAAWPALGAERTLCTVAYLAVAGSVLFPVWFFQGMEDMRTITIISIVARILVVMAIFGLVKQESDYVLAAALQAGTMVIAGLAGLVIILRRSDIPLVRPGHAQVREQIHKGWHIFTSTAAITLYTNSNIFILGLLTNHAVVGYFSAADQLVKAAQGLLTPISQAIYPHISALVEVSREKALRFIHTSFIRIGLLSCSLSILLMLLAEPLVLVILGDQYTDAILVLRILALIPVLVAMSNIFGIQTMLTFGLNREFSRILIWSGIINLGLIVPLAFLYQAPGAAISVVVTETIVTVTMALSLARNGLGSVFRGNRQWT